MSGDWVAAGLGCRASGLCPQGQEHPRGQGPVQAWPPASLPRGRGTSVGSGSAVPPTSRPPRGATIVITTLRGQAHWCKICLLSPYSSKNNKQLQPRLWVDVYLLPWRNMERTTMSSYSVKTFWSLKHKMHNHEPLPGSTAGTGNLREDRGHCHRASKVEGINRKLETGRDQQLRR